LRKLSDRFSSFDPGYPRFSGGSIVHCTLLGRNSGPPVVVSVCGVLYVAPQ
jgi:hypothetical protein